MSDVIRHCQKNHNYNDKDMQILEKELKRFLIIAILNKDFNLGMYSKDVDNLWHSFILFTKDYADFCKNNGGHFIHHVPEIEEIIPLEIYDKNFTDFQLFMKKYEETFNEEIHPIWLLDMCENNKDN